MRVTLPHNGWKPREYQKDAWREWMKGCRHLELLWHRRAGKDDICLHGTAIKAMERVAPYWHMLPKANQARKAIWDAVDPHTGKKRIDIAFPKEIRRKTRDNDMFIEFLNGSTWQVIGSDNYANAIGSSPAGIVYSEWALSNPAAKAYLRPILAENNGWQLAIGTPRGKNHAYKTFNTALKDPESFAQKLSAEQTGVFSDKQLQTELQGYIDEYGVDQGTALYEQEYLVSFDAAILGAFYSVEVKDLEREGRLCEFEHDPDFPVYTAWDIGFTDDTAIWFYQVIFGEVRLIDSISVSGKDPDWFCGQLLGHKVDINIVYNQIEVEFGEDIEGIEHRKAYNYAKIWLPHDAKARTLAAKGKSLEELLGKVFGHKRVSLVPKLSPQDGIQAVRKMLPKVWVHTRCEDEWEAVKMYRREWDDDKKMFKDNPVHDWTSHISDALRYLAVVYTEKVAAQPKDGMIKGINSVTLDDLWKTNTSKKTQRI